MTNDNDVTDEIMCSCSGTTRGKIYDLYKQGLDIDGISQRTGIKTGCGGCEWDIEAFVTALKEVDSAC
jgi:bacterioferritin-associated ferredoxin